MCCDVPREFCQAHGPSGTGLLCVFHHAVRVARVGTWTPWSLFSQGWQQHKITSPLQTHTCSAPVLPAGLLGGHDSHHSTAVPWASLLFPLPECTAPGYSITWLLSSLSYHLPKSSSLANLYIIVTLRAFHTFVCNSLTHAIHLCIVLSTRI